MIGITTIKEMIMSMNVMIIILLQCWFEFESYFVFHFNTKIIDFFEITKLYINNLYILKLNSNERIVEYQRL